MDNSGIEDLTCNGLLKVLNVSTIYKYVPFDTAVNFIIKDTSLKFTKPSEFNDPFDCYEGLIEFDISNEFKRKMFNESDFGLKRRERRKQERAITLNTFIKSMKTIKNQYRISCFSEKFDEILMWSHYADKHRGICIGFGFPERIGYKDHFKIYPVNYMDEIVPLSAKTPTIRAIYYWLTTKSIHWEYEKEIRAISNENTDIIKIEKEHFKEIIFGCNVSPSKIDQVKKLLKELKYPRDIVLKRMEINKDSFGLKVLKVNNRL